MKNLLFTEDRTYYDVGFTEDLEPFMENDYDPDSLVYIEGFNTYEEAKACVKGIVMSNDKVEYACVLKMYTSLIDDSLTTNDCSVIYEIYDRDVVEDLGKEKVIN